MVIKKIFDTLNPMADSTLRLYDTKQQKKRPFKPLIGKTVRIYTCGPSVYAYSHIGNFRTYLFEDMLVRYLAFKGFYVKRVMNITDIEDKAISAASDKGISLSALENSKAKAFFRDFKNLGMLAPNKVIKASDAVPDIIRLIKRICRNGYCIKEKDGIYFNTRKFRGYGRLRHLSCREYYGKAMDDDYSKEGIWDFRLWKYWSEKDGATGWDSPWGKGRPGWHIECSAISMKQLGDRFDIHCGGVDNIFPHHENEIAQDRAATGKNPVNFWMHSKHLTVGKKKMSKRIGNVLYVSGLGKKGVKPRCLRFYLISERYRSKLDFTFAEFKKRLADCIHARKMMSELRKCKQQGSGTAGKHIATKLLQGFETAMDDDLNTKLAFKRIFRIFQEAELLMKDGVLSSGDAKHILSAATRIDSVLGVLGLS